jgi:hypothetical protein
MTRKDILDRLEEIHLKISTWEDDPEDIPTWVLDRLEEIGVSIALALRKEELDE